MESSPAENRVEPVSGGAARKPFYRSLSFWLGIFGFLGMLFLWVDSCRNRTIAIRERRPGLLSAGLHIKDGTMEVEVWRTVSLSGAPTAYWERQRLDTDSGSELPMLLEWNGREGMFRIRIWRLVAMYLVAWFVIVGWRAWRYRRFPASPGAGEVPASPP